MVNISHCRNFCFIAILFLSICISATAQTDEEKPTVVKQFPANIPLKVNIDLPERSEDYLEKLRVRVTNTGGKPISSLRMELYLITDEMIIAPDGRRTWSSISLVFGRRELSSGYDAMHNPEDPVIDPNEEYTFRINKYQAASRKRGIANGTRRPVLSYRLSFTDLTYADGTGFLEKGNSYSKKTKSYF